MKAPTDDEFWSLLKEADAAYSSGEPELAATLYAAAGNSKSSPVSQDDLERMKNAAIFYKETGREPVGTEKFRIAIKSLTLFSAIGSALSPTSVGARVAGNVGNVIAGIGGGIALGTAFGGIVGAVVGGIAGAAVGAWKAAESDSAMEFTTMRRKDKE